MKKHCSKKTKGFMRALKQSRKSLVKLINQATPLWHYLKNTKWFIKGKYEFCVEKYPKYVEVTIFQVRGYRNKELKRKRWLHNFTFTLEELKSFMFWRG